MVERTSYRVYTAHELRNMPQAALRLSAPPPGKGISGAGVAFLLGVALAIGGASWAAMHYVKPDFIADTTAMEVKGAVPPTAATTRATTSAPPAFVAAAGQQAASGDATPAASPTSASAKQLAKPKKGRRQARPRPSAADGTAVAAGGVPPNPFDDLSSVDRGATVRQ